MHVQSGCFGCRSLDVAVVVAFNRDLRIRQRQRQRERLELNRFIWAKQQLCPYKSCTFYLTIVANKAEIEKKIAVSVNSLEYYYNKWKPFIEKKFVR